MSTCISIRVWRHTHMSIDTLQRGVPDLPTTLDTPISASCPHVCTDMCAGMCTDMCRMRRQRQLTRSWRRGSTDLGMCADMCAGMCADLCVDMCADMCVEHMHWHAYRNCCRSVIDRWHRHMNTLGLLVATRVLRRMHNYVRTHARMHTCIDGSHSA